MSYVNLFRLAGKQVVDSFYVGTYSGEWIVKLEDGTFYRGNFGSCSYCDTLQSMRADHPYMDDCDGFDFDSPNLNCPECASLEKRLIDYANSFEPLTKEELIGMFSPRSEWDSEADEILSWLRKQE